MNTTITQRLEIDAGHRLMKHESKCRNVHGHRYAFEVSLTTDQLDAVGRVLDFSRVKALLGGWLDTHWDHGMILQDGDPVITALQTLNDGTKLYTMPYPPSAEVLAEYFFRAASRLLAGSGVRVVAVKVFETPNCSATYTGA